MKKNRSCFSSWFHCFPKRVYYYLATNYIYLHSKYFELYWSNCWSVNIDFQALKITVSAMRPDWMPLQNFRIFDFLVFIRQWAYNWSKVINFYVGLYEAQKLNWPKRLLSDYILTHKTRKFVRFLR